MHIPIILPCGEIYARHTLRRFLQPAVRTDGDMLHVYAGALAAYPEDLVCAACTHVMRRGGNRRLPPLRAFIDFMEPERRRRAARQSA